MNNFAGLKDNFQQGNGYEKYQFFYHPDHLGSSSFITDTEGEVVQHIEYVPYGEVFIEERNNVWNTPYLFNAKEFDEETGLYYYGARYYDPRLAMWLGVDPLTEKYPSMGAYVYCANNPVKLVDPDGRKIIITHYVSDPDNYGCGVYESGHLNKLSCDILQSFAMTKEGYEFLSQYATAGQRIGSVEFKENGVYSDQSLTIQEHNEVLTPNGSFTARRNGNELEFFIELKIRKDEKEGTLITLGHEAFIHMDIYDDQLIIAARTKNNESIDKAIRDYHSKAGEKGVNDHKKYINNNSAYSRINRYIDQLSKIKGLTKDNVTKAKNKHDATYKMKKK